MEVLCFCDAEKLEAEYKAESSGNSSKRGRDRLSLECYTVSIVVNIVVSKATLGQMFTPQSNIRGLSLKLVA